MKKNILLAEDDTSMGFLLKDSLENYGYVVCLVADGKSALAKFNSQPFDLCILDVMMPVMDGFSLAAEIRKVDTLTPIIFLTAKAMKEDRIKGFKLGADDYVTKPFSVEELTLRMNVIFKRGKSIQPYTQEISFAGYTLELNNLILNTKKDTIQLTQKEADILAYFASHPNTLLKRELILQAVWNDDGYFVGRSLDVFISKLRKYLKENPAIKIVNIHGTGYKFQVEEA